jgi:Mrp family chromosome partitioning ATPase
MKSKTKAQKRKARRASMAFLENYPANSRFAEAFRTLRTNIQFSFLDKEFRAILVTSAGQAEGKTTVTMNLAHTMAKAGNSVLMMDADLRKPTLSDLSGTHKSRGLTGLISELFDTTVGEGRLGELGVSDLIRLLTLQKKSGRLHLDDGNESVEIRFAKGGIKGVNWLTRPDEKKLAAILGKGGLITTEQATQAIMRQKDTGQKLGFIIINMGMLTEDKLKGPLTIHMIEGLRAALQMKRGAFRFEEFQETESDQASFDPVDFDQVYTRALIGNEEIPFLHKGIDKAILKTNTENLFLLPSGRIAPNPSEVMGSNRMSFLITHLKERFDRMIIDTPPILPASDALILTPRTDGVVLVVKAGLMNRELVKNTVHQLRLAQANLLGIILNRVDLNREGYYKYYHKYYSKYYGEDAENK